MATKTAGRAAHQQPVKPIKGKPPRHGGPTIADNLRELEEKYGGQVTWHHSADDTEVIASLDDPDGDRISGKGKTRAEAAEALAAKLTKWGR